MNTRQCGLIVVLALIAGLTGGMVFSYLLVGRPVLAEMAKRNEQVVVARQFYSVDKHGKTRAVLEFSPSRVPNLAMLDENGTVRAALALMKDGTPFLGMLDENGEPIWKAP